MSTTATTDAGENIYLARRNMIEDRTRDFDSLVNLWLKKRDFSHFGMSLVWAECTSCVIAGAIALRKKNEFNTALECWRVARRALDALNVGIEARSKLSAAECSAPDCADFRARDLLHLQYCLLFAGDLPRLLRVREIYELPFVSMLDNGKDDAIAAEARMHFAAWDGNVKEVEVLAKTLDDHYKRFKLSPVYTQLWRAVANRDSEMLNSRLPEAEVAYKKSSKRKTNDFWGGGKDYNESMFDIYGASVLKIARHVGMSWSYASTNTKDIWPDAVVAYWEA